MAETMSSVATPMRHQLPINAHNRIAPSMPRPIPPRLEILSPVNQNGSFDFDRVLKSGEVMKRSRKTRQWRRFYLVLRPNLLSIYKNSGEERLHKQVTLSDLTAVAILKDPKGRRNHIFALFSPSRNHHFQADSAADARSWVDIITREAHIDEDEDKFISCSPFGESPSRYSAKMKLLRRSTEPLEEEDNHRPSSPEPFEPAVKSLGFKIPAIRQTSFQENEFSGNEHYSCSDLSDAPVSKSHLGSPPLSRTTSRPKSPHQSALSTSPAAARPIPIRKGSQLSTKSLNEDERVIWSGHLLALRSKGGVRQWKKLWVVVRPMHVALYKNDEEYSAHLILPMFNIINAVEIDPLSRSKAHCFQLIAEDKSYRFCASDEESLSRCLGALKSQLAKRKERHA